MPKIELHMLRLLKLTALTMMLLPGQDKYKLTPKEILTWPEIPDGEEEPGLLTVSLMVTTVRMLRKQVTMTRAVEKMMNMRFQWSNKQWLSLRTATNLEQESAKKYVEIIFTPRLVGPWSWSLGLLVPPFNFKAGADWLSISNYQTRTVMSAMVCKYYGLVKISRHYEVGPYVCAVSALVLKSFYGKTEEFDTCTRS